MPQENNTNVKPRKVYEDYHGDIPFWIAVADGILRFHELGYIDNEGRIFDPIGFFIRCDK